jgi:hypothetical protein
VPGQSGGEPVGWSAATGDQATQWPTDASESPNQTIDALLGPDVFGEEETEEARRYREEQEELTRRSEELEGYARVADRQASESETYGKYDERDELRRKALQLRESAASLRKKIKAPTLTR